MHGVVSQGGQRGAQIHRQILGLHTGVEPSRITTAIAMARVDTAPNQNSLDPLSQQHLVDCGHGKTIAQPLAQPVQYPLIRRQAGIGFNSRSPIGVGTVLRFGGHW